MTKVWIVTTGSYSDYNINRVFSTEALAVDHAASLNASGSYYDDAEVHEWEVDKKPLPRRTLYTCKIRQTGDDDPVIEGEWSSVTWGDGDDEMRPRAHDISQYNRATPEMVTHNRHMGAGISFHDETREPFVIPARPRICQVQRSADTADKARKACYDALAQLKAEHEGLT